MVAVVQTNTCHDCKALVDVLIGRQGVEGPTGDPSYDKDLGVCSECRGTALSPWIEGGPCPQCGEPMEMDENGMVTMWD